MNSDFPFPVNSAHAHVDSKLYFSDGKLFLNLTFLSFLNIESTQLACLDGWKSDCVEQLHWRR